MKQQQKLQTMTNKRLFNEVYSFLSTPDNWGKQCYQNLCFVPAYRIIELIEADLKRNRINGGSDKVIQRMKEIIFIVGMVDFLYSPEISRFILDKKMISYIFNMDYLGIWGNLDYA